MFLSEGRTELYDQVFSQCFQRNLVWFKILTRSGHHGWVSAKFLVPAIERGPSDADSSQRSTSSQDQNGGPQENSLRDLVFSYLFLELCREGRYLTASNWQRIEQRYDQKISETSISEARLNELTNRLKAHDSYQLMLLGLMGQNGSHDPYWQEQCNGIAAGFMTL